MIKGVYKKPPSGPWENRHIPPWKVERPKKDPNYHNPIITQKNPVKSKQSTTEGTQPPQGNLEAIHVMDTIAKSLGLISLAAIVGIFGLISLGFLDMDSVGSALDKIGSDVGNLVPNIIKDNDVPDSQNKGTGKCPATSCDWECCNAAREDETMYFQGQKITPKVGGFAIPGNCLCPDDMTQYREPYVNAEGVYIRWCDCN